jgi:hypothetical protein
LRFRGLFGIYKIDPFLRADMPKSSLPFNPSEYALVADRITLFYKSHPSGRIVTELVSRDRDVLFKASVYRSAADKQPSATGWALEREGDGEINQVACVENTETSAIGRALANLGFTASLKRPSREEMEKAERSRSGLYRPSDKTYSSARVSEGPETTTGNTPEPSSAESRARDRRADLKELVLEAGNRGMPPSVLKGLQGRIEDLNATGAELLEIERRVRHWLLHRAKPAVESGQIAATSAPDVNSLHQ